MKFLTPPSLPEGDYCRTLKIPDDKLWLGIFNKALLETIYPWNWKQVNDTDLTIEECTALCYVIFEEYLATNSCAGEELAPFWDDADGDDATGDEIDSGFPWYEDLADFVVTAFLATSFTPAAAIEFVTIARKFRLAFRTRNYGAIVNIFLNGVLQPSVDTYSAAPGMVYADFLVPSGDPAAVPLRIVHSGTANPLATPTSDGYAIEVIRKRLTADEMGIQDIRTVGGQVQVQRSIAGAWENIPDAEYVRRDGSLNPDLLGDFIVQPGEIQLKGATGGGAKFRINGGANFWTLGSTSAANVDMIRMIPTTPTESIDLSATLMSLALDINHKRATSTAAKRVASAMRSGWAEPTDAIRLGYMSLLAADATLEREFLRGGTNGTAPTLGLLGAAPVVRQIISGSDGGNLALRDLLTKLATAGLITNSTTEGTPEGDMIILRQNPDDLCQLEQSHDGGDTWILAFDYNLCGDPPTPGSEGWVIEDPGTIHPDAPKDTFIYDEGMTEEDGEIGVQALCAAVTATVGAMLDMYADAREEALNPINMIAAAFALAAAIAAFIFTAGASIVLSLAVVSAAMYVLSAYTSIVTTAMVNNATTRERMICTLYEALLLRTVSVENFKSAMDDGVACLTGDEQKVAQMMQAQLNSPYGDDLYMGFLETLGAARLAARSGMSLPDCVPCEEVTWCYEFTDEEFLSMWEFTSNVAPFVGRLWTPGMVESYSTTGNQNLVFTAKFGGLYIPPGTTVTGISLYRDKPNGAASVTQIYSLNGTEYVNGALGAGLGWATYNYGLPLTGTMLSPHWGFYSNQPAGSGVILAYKLRIEGTGVPMFGICNNCV